MICPQIQPKYKYLRLYCLVFALFCLPLFSQAQVLSNEELIHKLRDGGYNLYFRHAATNWSQHDRIAKAGDWTSCDPAQVRQLSQAGRESARLIGIAIRELGIPIAAVFASPYCRTVETAELFDLGEVKSSNDIINMRVADYFGGPAAVIQTARKRLAQMPSTKGNNVFVAHGNVAVSATEVYPKEGEMLVFQPLGDSEFRFKGRLTLEQLQQLQASLTTNK